jgi:hypothetical protein
MIRPRALLREAGVATNPPETIIPFEETAKVQGLRHQSTPVSPAELRLLWVVVKGSVFWEVLPQSTPDPDEQFFFCNDVFSGL